MDAEIIDFNTPRITGYLSSEMLDINDITDAFSAQGEGTNEAHVDYYCHFTKIPKSPFSLNFTRLHMPKPFLKNKCQLMLFLIFLMIINTMIKKGIVVNEKLTRFY